MEQLRRQMTRILEVGKVGYELVRILYSAIFFQRLFLCSLAFYASDFHSYQLGSFFDSMNLSCSTTGGFFEIDFFVNNLSF